MRFACLVFLVACQSTYRAPVAPAPERSRLVELESHTAAPGNVAVYLRADGEEADALAGLSVDKFKLFEDENEISPYEAQITMTNPVGAAHYTLVLVDVSKSITATTQMETLAAAMAVFKGRASENYKVAVCAFDGQRQITLLADWDASADVASSMLAGHAAKDPSTNLNGALLHGARYLNEALSKASHPLKFGTLVVITDGTDRARWVSSDDMLKVLDESPLNVFVVGLGGELNKPVLERIAKDGKIVEAQSGVVSAGLDELMARIERQVKRVYLFSYCSPARAGSHVLRIETMTPSGKRARLEKTFVAAGFGPGCDPTTPPPIGQALRRAQKLIVR